MLHNLFLFIACYVCNFLVVEFVYLTKRVHKRFPLFCFPTDGYGHRARSSVDFFLSSSASIISSYPFVFVVFFSVFSHRLNNNNNDDTKKRSIKHRLLLIFPTCRFVYIPITTSVYVGIYSTSIYTE